MHVSLMHTYDCLTKEEIKQIFEQMDYIQSWHPTIGNLNMKNKL